MTSPWKPLSAADRERVIERLAERSYEVDQGAVAFLSTALLAVGVIVVVNGPGRVGQFAAGLMLIGAIAVSWWIVKVYGSFKADEERRDLRRHSEEMLEVKLRARDSYLARELFHYRDDA